MLLVVIGITFGSMLGLLDNWILFRHIENNRRKGKELLTGIGEVFLIRYLIDATALAAFSWITRNGYAIVAAALSITVAVKISLFLILTRKGGKID